MILACAAATASAQTKFTMSGKCAKPETQQAAPAGDVPDHVFTLSTGKCTPVKAAEFGGSASKEGAFAEHGEVTGTKNHSNGTYVETLANGEKVYYTYETNSVVDKGVIQSWQNKWQITGGSAKLKGIKGKGTCTGKGGADGSLEFDCTGDYTLAKP
jgi:hypothetical protein